MDKIRDRLQSWQEMADPVSAFLGKLYAYPLVVLSISFALGIVAANEFFVKLLPVSVSIFLLTAFFVLTVILYKFADGSKFLSFLLILCSSLAFFCFGMIRLTSYKTLPANDISCFVNSPETIATVRGRVISSPVISDNSDWAMERFSYQPATTKFYFQVDSVSSDDKFTAASGVIKVYIKEAVLNISSGQRLELLCKLSPFTSLNNPASFNVKAYMANKNVYLFASVRSSASIKVLSSKASFLTRAKLFIRSRCSTALLSYENQSLPVSLLKTLLLGDRSDISSSVLNVFKRTSLLHFISLSGLHIGIVLGFIWLILNPIVSSKSIKAAVCIIAVVIFLLVIPPRPASIRACIIAVFLCFSVIFRRSPSHLNSLGLSAIVLMLITPTDIYTLGFQLSFACVTGILLFSRKLSMLILELLSRVWPSAASKKFIVAVASIYSAGLSAQLASALILIYNFHTINFFSSLWTLLIFPFVGLILSLSVLKIAVYSLFPTAALLLAFILKYIIFTAIFIVDFISCHFSGQITVGSISLMAVFLYYLLIFIFINRYLIAVKFRKPVLLFLALFFVVSFVISLPHKSKSLKLTLLSVGAGQALVVQQLDKTYIFDAGSATISDIGSKIVNPFLLSSGISKIDSIFLSHDDTDHFNGFVEVFSANKVNQVTGNITFTDKSSATARFLNTFLAEKGKTLQNNPFGPITGSLLKCTLLWPLPKSQFDYDTKTLNDNNLSNVYLLEYADRKILIYSDIQQFTQQQLLKLYPNLSADIIILPHHGLNKTLDANAINSLNTKWAFASCSQSQYRRAVKKLAETEIFYTSVHGSIAITISPAGEVKIATTK